MDDEMSCGRVKGLGLFDKVRVRFSKLIADVPPEIARCEFECRRANCPADEIERCAQRIEFADRLRRNLEADGGGGADSKS